ncbi:bifunctional diaminohydroxyphosphoribosylaminopyrimidine deaminase/5-amino-6-(5-phosphoribosylamino)uracil reductase RibD [Acuticoccus sp. 2012]|uniref:diaminohydroxyphosphoribosylaminopyrimidine deaminase n=2 Tax=Acuticoccus mangrovi TaxID=2796142 RepID=A0A934ISN0_9HYPH|nr:bifunctional diaminohydroxyphosphoribosylaminopyrimidine deaminase/5-amino-6-(5-phosphoribosylamino)uracil reductase RibD [Acuticoccus mangrovi]
MGEALMLARSMQGHVWPNPPVGCVIVRDGRVVGRGRTQVGGRPHAERVALDDAGPAARGATLYVTLEPCCHYGKTPPCADAIVAAGVARVFASLQDPDPRVNGGGFRRLREAGVAVEIGAGADEARQIMAGFFHRIAHGRPLITLGDALRPRRGVPDGFDGVLHSDHRGVHLLTRSGGDDRVANHPPLGTAAPLLALLGARGLTSLYVPLNDPLAQTLSPVSTNERHEPRTCDQISAPVF